MPESESNSPTVVKEAVETANANAINVTGAVVTGNIKAIGDAPSIAQNIVTSAMAQAQALSAQNAVSNQARIDAIANAATTRSVDKLLNTDPLDAVAINKIMTGNDLAGQLTSQLTALAGGQTGVKAAQTVPPVTAPGPAV